MSVFEVAVIGGGLWGRSLAKAAERAALVGKAEALGLKVKSNWSLERLSSEIQAAEAAAAKSGAKAADTPAAE